MRSSYTRFASLFAAAMSFACVDFSAVYARVNHGSQATVNPRASVCPVHGRDSRLEDALRGALPVTVPARLRSRFTERGTLI